MRGIVYCLTNPAMPDLVKIGRIESDGADALQARLKGLYTTGVPVPFELYYAVIVEDVNEAEELLHDTFSDARENPRREYFRIDAERVLAAMKLTRGTRISVSDVSDSEIDQAEIQARDRARTRENKRLSAFKFSDVDIPVGAKLQFVGNHEVTAIVTGNRTIKFEGETHSLSGAAGTILERDGRASTVAGPRYWEYEGKTLDQWRKDRLEQVEEDSDE